MSAAFATIARRLHNRLGQYLDKTSAGEGGLKAGPGLGQAAETEALASVLNGLGRNDTLVPLLMLEAFLSSGEHLTAEGFSDYLRQKEIDCTPEKAAEILELFNSAGFALKHHAADGSVLYEHTRPGLHHDHIICSGCGKTAEFNRPDVDGLIATIAHDEDFCHLDHQLVVYALCPECRRRRRAGLPLTEITAGERVVVAAIEGPDDFRRRLADLGFRKGAGLRVLGGQSGSVIVLLDGCRLALGPDMASGIMVRATGHEYHHHGGHGHHHCPHHKRHKD
ncbi:FeoA domain-containing protein [Deltaproteobacteria bacterium OttesenSCG-928-K17]|nr:FeoA domain-containing protein [Deltaproteobacteria bacterium OttesenSCG-928-K17]